MIKLSMQMRTVTWNRSPLVPFCLEQGAWSWFHSQRAAACAIEQPW
jgi:hypothetical protein